MSECQPLFVSIGTLCHYFCVFPQGMHPAFIGAQYPFSVATGPPPPMAATAVTFPGVPVPSMTQIAVHPYHAETGLPLSTTVAGQDIMGSFLSVCLVPIMVFVGVFLCFEGKIRAGEYPSESNTRYKCAKIAVTEDRNILSNKVQTEKDNNCLGF